MTTRRRTQPLTCGFCGAIGRDIRTTSTKPISPVTRCGENRGYCEKCGAKYKEGLVRTDGWTVECVAQWERRAGTP